MPPRQIYRRFPRPTIETPTARAPNSVYHLYHHPVLRPWRTPAPPIFNYLAPIIRRLFDVGFTFIQTHVIPRVFAAVTAFLRPHSHRAQPRNPVFVIISIDHYRRLLEAPRSYSSSEFTTPDHNPPEYFPPYYPPVQPVCESPTPADTTLSAGFGDPLAGRQ